MQLNMKSNWRVPLIFSYLGTIPFITFTILAAGNIHFPLLEDPQIIYFTHLAYAGLILFFLAGADWGKALKSGNIRQYLVAMGFSGLGFMMLVIAMIVQLDSALPLAGFSVLFILFYIAENWASKGAKIHFHQYTFHRMILTIIVVICLLISTYLHSRGVSY